MSVSNETAREQYTLTGADQVLPVSFYFLEASHLRVVKTVDGNDTDLTLNVGYTVTGAANPLGGSVTMIGGASGDKITIVRSVPFTQIVSYVENDQFPATVQERALDKLTQQVQQLRDELKRCVRLAISSPEAAPMAPSINSIADLLEAIGTVGDFVDAPDAPTSAGQFGQRAWANGYFYLCVQSGAEGSALWAQFPGMTNW